MSPKTLESRIRQLRQRIDLALGLTKATRTGDAIAHLQKLHEELVNLLAEQAQDQPPAWEIHK
jgi:hypothetical protein